MTLHLYLFSRALAASLFMAATVPLRHISGWERTLTRRWLGKREPPPRVGPFGL